MNPQEPEKSNNSMSLFGSIKKNITDIFDSIKKGTEDEILLSEEVKKKINLLALTVQVVLENKDIRNEIIAAVKSAADITKKSIEESRDKILNDKEFLNNLTNTSKKIVDQVSTAMYSTIDGLTLGTVSDVRAFYSSFLATLNSIDLLSSILKVPVSKLDEKIKNESKEIVTLFQSLNSIKKNYYATMEKLNEDMNNKSINNKSIKTIKKTVSTPLLSAPNSSVPLIKSVGGSYKKKKIKKHISISMSKKRIRNRNRGRGITRKLKRRQ